MPEFITTRYVSSAIRVGSTYDIAHIDALLLSVNGAWIAGQMIRRWRCKIYEGFQIFNKIQIFDLNGERRCKK